MDAAKVASVVTFAGPPSGTKVEDWVAKSREESSHRETVVNVGSGKRHVGLWQIQETHRGVGTPVTALMSPDKFVEWLKDPFNNFTVAKALYKGGGWTPWNASGGAPTVTAEDTEAAGAGGFNPDLFDEAGDLIGAAIDPLGDAVSMVRSFYEWIADRKNIGRVALGAMGLAIITGSLLALAKAPVVAAKEGII
jgi:hypothetical protein